ncbi:unnamed protein product [Sphenostylis stenocarpa]|nr:unnamed protein product [Sphenostylis stenocarpa]
MAMEEREGWLNCLACFYQFPAIRVRIPKGTTTPPPPTSIRTPPSLTKPTHSLSTQHNTTSKLQPLSPTKLKSKDKKTIINSARMKMGSPSMGGSKRRLSSRGLGGALREQRARLYIIRRCVVMLLCWHD